MEAKLFGFLAETSIHPGSGQDAGLVDLPVAREAATDYPVVVGSAFKGALRDSIFWRCYAPKYEAHIAACTNPDDTQIQKTAEDEARKFADQRADKYFGTSANGGEILVSDLRVLMLPIRSLTASYYWITCPHVIERLVRDEQRTGAAATDPNYGGLTKFHFLGNFEQPPKIFLEERQFERAGPLPTGLIELLGKYIPHPSTRARLNAQCVVLADDDFAWFARYGLAVTARNVLNRDTKTSKNLWYEETIPPDALFYCLLAGRTAGVLSKLTAELLEHPYLQVGGNETVGQGWFAVTEARRPEGK